MFWNFQSERICHTTDIINYKQRIIIPLFYDFMSVYRQLPLKHVRVSTFKSINDCQNTYKLYVYFLFILYTLNKRIRELIINTLTLSNLTQIFDLFNANSHHFRKTGQTRGLNSLTQFEISLLYSLFIFYICEVLVGNLWGFLSYIWEMYVEFKSVVFLHV
jgi:hypothetical protein